MKRIIFMILGLVLFLGATAQKPGTSISMTLDTLTNTSAKNGTTVIKLPSVQNSLTVQVLFTQLSGTSAGSAVLEGSVDGTTYHTINATSSTAVIFVNDTATVASGGKWAMTVLHPDLLYYRMRYIPSGTHSTKVTGKWMYK